MHEMRLHDKPFSLIKNGHKTIELRLYDEKRQLIRIGDIIQFENRLTGERISTKVLNIYKYRNFCELFEHFSKEELGFCQDETADYKDMELYYSIDEQEKYGVVGIQIELLK